MHNNTFLICICICVVILLYLLPKSRTCRRFYKNYSFKENKRVYTVGSSVQLRKSKNYYKRHYIHTYEWIWLTVCIYTILYSILSTIYHLNVLKICPIHSLQLQFHVCFVFKSWEQYNVCMRECIL